MYPSSLEDFAQEELEDELKRRIELQQQGKCDYCKRPIESSPCRYLIRHTHGIIELMADHKLATKPENMNGWSDQFGGSDYP